MPEKDAYSLIKACFDDLETAESLVNQNPEIIHVKTGLGETPLHYLVVENQIDAVKFLFEKGAEINTVNECGDTPLSQAVMLGYVELTGWLLEKGANLDIVNNVGDPLIHCAIRSGNVKVMKLLVSKGLSLHEKNSVSETPLHESAKDDEYLEVTKYLVENGAELDELGGFNDSPIFGAVLHNNINTVKYLVSKGASILIKDSHARTPESLAEECGHNEIAEWLKNKSTRLVG